MGAKNSRQRPQQPPAFQGYRTPAQPVHQNNFKVQETKVSNFGQIGNDNTLEMYKGEKKIQNDDLPIHETNLWKKYYGTVIGSRQEVQEALKLLGREPVDSNELCKAIFDWRRIDFANLHTENEYA